jgi:hypothetical protein
MDHDYPMTRTQVKVLVVGLVVMGGIGVALFGGAIPGLKPNFSQLNVVTVDGVQYDFALVYLSYPNLASSTSSPEAFVYGNVTFELWVTNWNGPSGGLVHGNGTEKNGTVYSFVLGEPLNSSVTSTLFISPDREFGAYWAGGPFGGPLVHLLVRSS